MDFDCWLVCRSDCTAPNMQQNSGPAIAKSESRDRVDQPRIDKKKRKPEKIEKPVYVCSSGGAATHLGQPVNTDLSEQGFIDGQGVRRCGAIGARGPCGRRYDLCQMSACAT